MKTRSEMLKERNKKASAEERTIPMYEEKNEEEDEDETPAPKAKSDKGPKVECPACEESMYLSSLEQREDGLYECLHCAAPIEEPGDKATKVEKSEKKEKESKAPKAKEEKSEPLKARSGSFCGDCGAEWPGVAGNFKINCGHTKALRVDDPRKATKMAAVTSSGITSPPNEPVSTHASPFPPSPGISMQGNRISISWGKTIFPVGEPRGFKFSNMDVGGHIITVEVPEGTDRVATARRIIAELQQIADIAFDTQFKWYQEKLGLIDK